MLKKTYFDYTFKVEVITTLKSYHLLSPDLFLLKLTGVPFRLFDPRTRSHEIDDNSSANRPLSRQSLLRFRVRVSRFRLLPLPESSICFWLLLVRDKRLSDGNVTYEQLPVFSYRFLSIISCIDPLSMKSMSRSSSVSHSSPPSWPVSRSDIHSVGSESLLLELEKAKKKIQRKVYSSSTDEDFKLYSP